ncbi:MAG: hypothetical protein MJE68_32330, partial [Proteobacteria bacterium]|nr:hypothetical protein [Pseudomonadota bacterium]
MAVLILHQRGQERDLNDQKTGKGMWPSINGLGVNSMSLHLLEKWFLLKQQGTLAAVKIIVSISLLRKKGRQYLNHSMPCPIRNCKTPILLHLRQTIIDPALDSVLVDLRDFKVAYV